MANNWIPTQAAPVYWDCDSGVSSLASGKAQAYCVSIGIGVRSQWRCFMRCSLAYSAMFSVCIAVSCSAQAPAARSTPEALTASYSNAMQAKDWAGAMSAARQLVGLSPSAEYLRLLAEAQLYSGAPADALATYDLAITQASKEKPQWARIPRSGRKPASWPCPRWRPWW